MAGKRCGQWRPVGAVRTPGAGTDPWAWTDPPPIAITGVAYRGRAPTAITAASYWGHREVHEVPKPLGYSHLLLGNSVGPRGCQAESSKVPQHGSSYLVLTDS